MFIYSNQTNEFWFKNSFYSFRLFLSFVLPLRSCRIFKIMLFHPGFGGIKYCALIHTMPTRGTAHGNTFGSFPSRRVTPRGFETWVGIFSNLISSSHSKLSSILVKNGTICTYFGYWDDETAWGFRKETCRLKRRQFLEFICCIFWRATFHVSLQVNFNV